MSRVSLEIDLAHHLPQQDDDAIAAILHEATQQHLLERARDLALQTWRAAVSGVLLEGMSQTIVSERYAQSLHAEIRGTRLEVWSDDPLAERIQRGHSAIDLKPGLLNGPRARRAKDGTRYSIVPFRHGTPGRGLNPLPNDVYRLARQNKPLTGEMRLRGIRSKPDILTGGRGSYTWSTGPLDSLRRYSNAPKAGSRYITFRAVSDRSAPASWIVPLRPANDIAGAVKQSVERMLPTL